jgi:hypothetical protein
MEVSLGCIQLSPSCPFRRLHTFHLLRPARSYSRFLGYGAPHFEHQRDFNPPEQHAAQHALWSCPTSDVCPSSAYAFRLPDAVCLENKYPRPVSSVSTMANGNAMAITRNANIGTNSVTSQYQTLTSRNTSSEHGPFGEQLRPAGNKPQGHQSQQVVQPRRPTPETAVYTQLR